MSNLPQGVTDEMCEPRVVECANCGHTAGAHYDKPQEAQVNDKDDIVPLACDIIVKVNNDGTKVQCNCEELIEGEFEPEIDEDKMKGL